jgi:membrane fusion protein (multidrug efflux system)
MRRTVFLMLALSTLVWRCAQDSAPEKTTADRPPVAVDAAPVTAGAVEERIAVVGSLTPKFQGEVKAEYSGVVSDVYVTEWVPVKKGALLGRFDSREVRAALEGARASRMQAEVAVARAQRERTRCEKLRAAGLATQQTLDDAVSAAEAAEAQLRATSAQEELVATRLRKTEIRAPMDGVVALRAVNPGDFIENMGSPRPMFRIVDNRRLELTVTVPSTRVAAVAVGQPLSFTVDALPGRTFEGRVSFVNPSIDEASRTMKVIAQVDNDSGALKAGLFARGEIVSGRREGVLRLPRTALVSWDQSGGTGLVYVIEGGRAHRKSVEVGASSGDSVEVRSGISEGETVVTRGAFDVRDGDRVNVAGSAGA